MRNALALIFCVLLFLGFVWVVPRSSVLAQERSTPLLELFETATDSASATDAAEVVKEKVDRNIEKDITLPTGPSKSRLATYLDEHPIGPLSPTNIIQHAIRRAVNNGVPANILVLLLLFPVVAALIAIFRRVIGLRGFGVYMPAVTAVAFVSTGITTGLMLFLAIFFATTLGKLVIGSIRLQYIPRTALILWVVSLFMFGLLLAYPAIPYVANIVSVGIFPLLVMVLLSENFMEAQLSGGFSRALSLTLETLVLAILSTLMMRTLEVQQFVLRYPELTILGVLLLDILVGKYTGLRVAELFRFKPIIDAEE